MFWFVFDKAADPHPPGLWFPKSIIGVQFLPPSSCDFLDVLGMGAAVPEEASGWRHKWPCSCWPLFARSLLHWEGHMPPRSPWLEARGQQETASFRKHTLSSRQLRKLGAYLASILEVTAAYFKSFYRTVTCCPHPRIGFLIKSQCAVTPPHVTRLLWRMCRASGSFAEVSNPEGTRFPLLEGGNFKENSERLVSFLFSPRLTSILSSLTPCTFPCIPCLSVIIFMIFKSLLLDAKVFLNHLRFKGKNDNH